MTMPTRDAPAQTVLTPTLRATGRRAAFWVALAVFAVIIATLAMGMLGSSVAGDPLSPTDAAPGGARAAAEVLRQQGIDVRVARSLREAREATTAPATTTLLLHDPGGVLDAAGLAETGALADRLVLVAPGFEGLEALAPGVANAGTVSGVLTADCDLRAVTNAGSVSGEGTGYRIVGEGALIGCLDSGDGIHSLVATEADGRTVIVLGATAALANESIALEGNAALVLTLLGERPTLVWYQPGTADLPGASISDLLPRWTIAMPFALIAIGVAAAVWRGRRFGPLVVERLPVIVRAAETTEGRARLYERASARSHALDALRIGTVGRLAERCGLPRTADVDEVTAAVAAIAGMSPAAVRALLLDREPGSDRDLVELSDALLELEARVAESTRDRVRATAPGTPST